MRPEKSSQAWPGSQLLSECGRGSPCAGSSSSDAPALSAADKAKAREFAKCMRKSGVVGRPDLNADGTFTVPERLAKPADAPLWQPQATGPCKQ
jgi:hypothetical protein